MKNDNVSAHHQQSKIKNPKGDASHASNEQEMVSSRHHINRSIDKETNGPFPEGKVLIVLETNKNMHSLTSNQDTTIQIPSKGNL